MMSLVVSSAYNHANCLSKANVGVFSVCSFWTAEYIHLLLACLEFHFVLREERVW